MPRRYEIPSTPQNMVWGYLDSSTPHILEVSSGDTVTLHSFPSGGKETLPDDINLVPSDYLAALEMLPPGPGSHFITGPIYVRGAAVGDALQIDILDVKVRQDWGFVSILPLLGTLPDEFTDYETIHPRIDRQRNVCIMPWGSEIPRAFGGNMDNKELRAGTTLYLPVFNEGALFFAGDGHAVQGDGEVCITALETGMTGTFRLTVRKDMELRWPFAESATHLMSIGLDEDLDDAAKQAVREMVKHVCARTNLTRNEAYMLCSLAGNLRVTQLVDGNKGIHMLLPKSLL